MRIEGKNDLFFVLICAICLTHALTDTSYMQNIKDLFGRAV